MNRRASPVRVGDRSDKGIRRPFGVAAKLTEFFAANPDEELTEQQIADKYDANLEAVRTAVLGLCREGVLEKVKVVRLPAKGRAS